MAKCCYFTKRQEEWIDGTEETPEVLSSTTLSWVNANGDDQGLLRIKSLPE